MESIKTKLKNGGRIIIPSSFRKLMHINDGDDLILHIDNNVISITTPESALKTLQNKLKKSLKDNSVSLTNELIQDRRKEANDE